MTDHATEHITINASLEKVFDAVTAFEDYPAWAPDIKDTTVHSRDADGRPVDVSFRAAAMGRSSTVRLTYDYSEAPYVLTWWLTDGDLLRRYDGEYRLQALDDPDDATDLGYSLTVDLVVPLPGFVKRRAEARLIKAALPDLKAYVESDGS